MIAHDQHSQFVFKLPENVLFCDLFLFKPLSPGLTKIGVNELLYNRMLTQCELLHPILAPIWL